MVALTSTWYSPGSIGALTRSIMTLPITAINGPCCNTNMPLCEMEYNWLLNMVVGIGGNSPFLFRSFIGNLSRGHRPEQVTLSGLTWPDERAVDELHHCTQDDRTCQDGQDVEASYHRADGIPHRGGEATEQRPTRGVHPVVVSL